MCILFVHVYNIIKKLLVIIKKNLKKLFECSVHLVTGLQKIVWMGR